MSEEKKNVKMELDLEDLGLVAGGAYVDGDEINYRCGFCGNYAIYHSKAEIKAHVRSCPKNPNNF